MKKILCLLMAVIMLLSLAACGGGGNEGGQSNNGEGSSESPTIIRWVASDPGHPGRDAVEEEVVRYVKEKLNVELDILWLPAENASILGTTIVADEWDVATVDAALFNSNVGRHAFLAIDDYIDAYMPTVKEALPEENFEVCQWKGSTYGVTPYKDFSEAWGILYNKDMFEEYGIELPTDYNTEMDLVPLYYEVTDAYRKANPSSTKCVIKVGTWLNSWFQYDNLYGGWSTPLAVTNIPGTEGMDDIESGTVFAPYFTDDFAEYVRTVWQLAKDDIIPSAPGDGDMEWTSGRGFCQVSCGWLECADNQFSESWDCGWFPANSSIKSTSTLQSRITVISSNCENPEAAAKFIELTFSDEYLCTTLKFGVKDRDWADANEDGVVELLDRNADGGNRFWYDWYGTRNSSLWKTKIAEGVSTDFLSNLADLNENGITSPYAGFVFDVSNVANEIAACNNVLTQYTGILKHPSFADPDVFVEEFRTALTANGIEKVIAEVQSQLDAWNAAQ